MRALPIDHVSARRLPTAQFPYDEVEDEVAASPDAPQEDLRAKMVVAFGRFLIWMMGPKHPNWDRRYDVKFAKAFTLRGLAALWTLRPDLLGEDQALRDLLKKELGDYSRLAHYADDFSNIFGVTGMRQRRNIARKGKGERGSGKAKERDARHGGD